MKTREGRDFHMKKKDNKQGKKKRNQKKSPQNKVRTTISDIMKILMVFGITMSGLLLAVFMPTVYAHFSDQQYEGVILVPKEVTGEVIYNLSEMEKYKMLAKETGDMLATELLSFYRWQDLQAEEFDLMGQVKEELDRFAAAGLIPKNSQELLTEESFVKAVHYNIGNGIQYMSVWKITFTSDTGSPASTLLLDADTYRIYDLRMYYGSIEEYWNALIEEAWKQDLPEGEEWADATGLEENYRLHYMLQENLCKYYSGLEYITDLGGFNAVRGIYANPLMRLMDDNSDKVDIPFFIYYEHANYKEKERIARIRVQVLSPMTALIYDQDDSPVNASQMGY